MAEYIEKQAAVSYAISGMVRTLPTNDGNENWIRTSEIRKNILNIPPADVVNKADLKTLLEQTEKELVKDVDRYSIAYNFIVSVMGIIKCKVNMMGEGKE